MPIREDQLNGRIATIIRECTPRSGWTITEETQGALASSARRPDILITRPEPEPPIVLENEYSAAPDCQGLPQQAGANACHRTRRADRQHGDRDTQPR